MDQEQAGESLPVVFSKRVKVDTRDAGQLPQPLQVLFMTGRFGESVVLIMSSIKARWSPNFVQMGNDNFQFDINVTLLRCLEKADDATATLGTRRKIYVELDGLRAQHFLFQLFLKIQDHPPFSVGPPIASFVWYVHFASTVFVFYNSKGNINVLEPVAMEPALVENADNLRRRRQSAHFVCMFLRVQLPQEAEGQDTLTVQSSSSAKKRWIGLGSVSADTA